jgi:hypothetical protein
MSQVIANLKAFNAKERFHLIGLALGNTSFTLAPQFRRQLEQAFNLPIREDAFAAMDYHLDWLFASLFYGAGIDEERALPRNNEEVAGNQEDIDFVVADQNGEVCNLFLLEAKGLSPWDNAQLRSKALRLRSIFENNGRRWAHFGVRPYFALASPRRPEGIEIHEWPDWMQTWNHVTMEMEPDLLKVMRCDAQGHGSFQGSHWMVTRRP